MVPVRFRPLTKLSGADAPSPNGAVGNHYRWQITPDESIDFIGAGRNLGADISGHFRSVPFRQSLHKAIEGRSLVVIDTPPVMSAAETAEIASEVDGIVLIVVKGTPMRKLIDARDRLELSGTPIIGYIFNKADVRSEQYYTYPNRTSVPS